MWLEVLAVVLGSIYLLKYLLSTRTPAGAKPYNSIPSPKGWPILGSFSEFLPGGKYVGAMHRWMVDRNTKYGPIVRDNIFGLHIVLLADGNHIEEMLKHDDKYPVLFLTADEATNAAKENLRSSYGMLTSTGETWKKIRSPWNHTMLKTSKVYEGLENLNEISDDFITRVQERRNDTGVVVDLDRELFRWSLESAGSFIFETRLGCLSNEGSVRAEEMIQAARDMFDLGEKLYTNGPMWLSRLFARDLVRNYFKAWDTIAKHSKHLVDAKIDAIAKELEVGIEPSGFLSSVIAMKKNSIEEIYSTVSELLFAAVETTSHTMHFALYELARDPEVQEKVYNEICEVTGGVEPAANHLHKLEYLKATIKETQRKYPVGLGTSRVLQKDAVIGGYHIPAGVFLLTSAYYNGNNEDLFPDAQKLKPERWTSGECKVNTMTINPFGLGSRGCIGQKTAEAEIYILIIRILQRFQLTVEKDVRPKLVTKTILAVQDPIPVMFVDRR